MVRCFPQLFSSIALLAAKANAALTIASALSVIEWTPEKVAAEDYFKGNVTIINGGVPSLFSNSSVDLASNAETQALRNFANHTNLRIIYTVSEVAYRIVADKRKVKTLEDLKGKKIGALPATSSGYFVERFMENVGLDTTDYEVVRGNVCLVEPCANNTFPIMLQDGRIDAVGMWEPTVELASRAIGTNNSIFFQDFNVYREIFNLHTTTQKLNDPFKRREIVSFIRALDKALDIFQNQPDKVYKRAAEAVSPQMEEWLMKAVWPVHRWPGTIPRDLLDVMVKEDGYVATVDKRKRLTRQELTALVDRSILREAREEDDDDEELAEEEA